MMILSQDGMVAVNSDNVVMFEVKETETLPHETQLCATMRGTCSLRTRHAHIFQTPEHDICGKATSYKRTA